jgi:hypothetical protein
MLVIYHILKDQLRIAQKNLLEMKKKRFKDFQKAVAFNREMKSAAIINQKLKLSRRIATNPDNVDAYHSINPELRKVIMSLVTSDVKQHSKWCPCCHTYQKGEDPTP